MRTVAACLASVMGLGVVPAWAQGASPDTTSITLSVPRLVNVSGEYRPKDGGSAVPLETVTLRIYPAQGGGVPLWQETQTVAVDPYGFYTVVLGATQKEGIPAHVFASSEAQWLSLSWARDGSVEGARTRLTSVPYALRAADAETLGGLPASAFQLAAPYSSRAVAGVQNMASALRTASGDAAAPAATEASPAVAQSPRPKAVNTGALGYIARYVNSTDVANSDLYEINGYFGFNTTTPQDIIHSRFSNSDGTLTGLAVQNMGSGALSYSGMLFYDQNGAVAQFQGFGNVTHEYRINNVASNGSINFMLGGTSLFKLDPAGKVLVGNPTAPEATSITQAMFEVMQPASGPRNGIFARKQQSSTNAAAIEARSAPGTLGTVVRAEAGVADNTQYIAPAALIGANENTNGWGVYAYGLTWAGYFSGNVNIVGTLTKSAGSFRIDHPLDPEHKYLQHSFVESPDMKNIYDGNAVLDDQGAAWVTLPEWFEALNRDFRYQLTAIGGAAPNLHIAEKIAGNRFRIAGGAPGTEVSWQVTGIRQDAYANANRIAVELEKSPDEVGKYLHPKALGVPVEKSTNSLYVTTRTMEPAPAPRPR